MRLIKNAKVGDELVISAPYGREGNFWQMSHYKITKFGHEYVALQSEPSRPDHKYPGERHTAAISFDKYEISTEFDNVSDISRKVIARETKKFARAMKKQVAHGSGVEQSAAKVALNSEYGAFGRNTIKQVKIDYLQEQIDLAKNTYYVSYWERSANDYFISLLKKGIDDLKIEDPVDLLVNGEKVGVIPNSRYIEVTTSSGDIDTVEFDNLSVTFGDQKLVPVEPEEFIVSDPAETMPDKILGAPVITVNSEEVKVPEDGFIFTEEYPESGEEDKPKYDKFGFRIKKR